MDRGAWQAILRGLSKSWIQLKRLRTHACILAAVAETNTTLQSNYPPITFFKNDLKILQEFPLNNIFVVWAPNVHE